MWFKISTVNGAEYVEADMVREEDNYSKGITDNQQPCICFYEGYNPTRDHVVGHYVLKNIGGYRKLRPEEIRNNRPLISQ